MLLDSCSSQDPQAPAVSLPTSPGVADEEPTPAFAGKKTTRQWDAWTREEEESFFIALRHVGKNFEKITSRVQSKNKDQVRHYYYRLIKRMNKLLGPGFLLDAKNSKDANSAMLRWWSLLEKHSCSASKLHLKPRRFKTFVTALEHQLSKDRMKANKKKAPRSAPVVTGPVIAAPVSGKTTMCSSDTTKNVAVGDLRLQKAGSGRGNAAKRKTEPSTVRSKAESSRPPRQRKKSTADCNVSAAAFKKWEKAASAGVNLVAEAAEQLERAAAAEQLEQGGPSHALLKPCTPLAISMISEVNVDSVPASLSTSHSQLAPDLREVSQGNHVDAVVELGNQGAKLKLQLFPIDEATRRSLEQDGLNPYLELTLKPRKAVSSVLNHLAQKWGRSSAVAGHIQLFPFSTQVKNIATSQSWSFNDTFVTAGDVHAALGKPSVFRLRYGWFPSRILQSSNAELPQLFGCSLSPTDCMKAELQMNLLSNRDNDQINRNIDRIHQSMHVLSSLGFPSSPSMGTENDLGTGACVISSQTKVAGCAYSGSIRQKEGAAQSACTTCNTTSKAPFIETMNFPSCRMLEGDVAGLAHPRKVSDALDSQVDTDPRKSGLSEKDPPVSMECSSGLVQVEERKGNFDEEPTCSPRENGDILPMKNGHKIQEIGSHLGNCSWLYEGSNDSFGQRLWNIEDPPNNGSLLPTELDWVDSLTNISVGDLLNEVSQAAQMSSGAISTQALQPLQSLESFDPAVAAQNVYSSRIESNLIQHTGTPAWDGEDTRDAFVFQKVVLQRRTSVPMNYGTEPSSRQEASKVLDSMAVSLSDCGSLEAWKQSFGHVELPYTEELKGDSAQFSQQPPDAKRCSSQEFYWADSLGSLDSGMITSAGDPGHQPPFSRGISLGGMVVSGLEVFSVDSSQKTGNSIPLSSSCELQSTQSTSVVPARSVCSTVRNASENLQKEAMIRPGGMSSC